MATITLHLATGDHERLCELARREYRDPRAQAVVLIVEGLRRAGLDDRPADQRPADQRPAGTQR